MTIGIQIMRCEGSDPAIALPSYETAGAAGMDVRANLPQDERAVGISLSPQSRAMVPTGLRVAIPEGYEIQVRPRSGLAHKAGLTLINAPGTIDSDYRGELGLLVVNLGDSDVRILHGMRIAQLVVAPVVRADWIEVQELNETRRGSGGFGSTGRN